MGASPTVDTRDGLERFYRQLFAAAPGYRVTVDGGTYADDLGVLWGAVTDTSRPEAGPEVPAVFVCTFEEGRFRHDRVYADFTRLSALIGPGA
jgi:hypothetical protein